MSKRRFELLFLCGLVIGISACGGPRHTVKIVHVPLGPSSTPSRKLPTYQKPYTVNGKTYYPLPSAEGYVEEGLASWYGPKFHGRPTASGEPFNMYAFTAAHKVLPLGTYVLVVNLENGRQVVVRINDRGPFVSGRIIDLSYAAARALGMLEKGVVPVRIIALARGKKTPKGIVFADIPRLKKGEYYLQVGSFKNYANAVRLQQRLARRYKVVTIEPFDRGKEVFYRVKIFLAYDLDKAQRLAREIKKMFPEAFVVAQ